MRSAALARLPELGEIKKGQGKDADSARPSTTDVDASVMKMGDRGFRPAYNIQYGTDTDSQIIVGVDVVSTGSDQAQMAPMVEQLAERCGHTPEHWLVDGGYPAHKQIDAVAERTTVLAPVPQSKDKQVDPHQPKAGDSQAVAEWRKRMASDEAKQRYKDRAASAECVNAQARNRGLIRLNVRGLTKVKVKAVAVLFALAHNLMRMAALAPALIGIGTGTSAAAVQAKEVDSANPMAAFGKSGRTNVRHGAKAAMTAGCRCRRSATPSIEPLLAAIRAQSRAACCPAIHQGRLSIVRQRQIPATWMPSHRSSPSPGTPAVGFGRRSGNQRNRR